jgi:hypothetical protein
MNLKLEQVQRLCGIERSLCQGVLDALVEAGFLRVRLDGCYVRVGDETLIRFDHRGVRSGLS